MLRTLWQLLYVMPIGHWEGFNRMIAFVEGVLVEKTPTQIVVNVGGIGLEIDIPLSSYQALGDVDMTVKVSTHFHVREDALLLFGFATADEKQLFVQLISVSGIGPKLALNILSGTTVSDFTAAILTEDVKTLSSISGVGKKTAQRLVIELRDRFGAAGIEPMGELPITPAKGDQRMVSDAILGLIALGYERAEARKAVAQAASGVDGNITAEGLIRRVLQQGGR
jgi:Holliday junction DNA helicase RuvA